MYRKPILFVILVTLQMLMAANAIAADAWWSGNSYDNLWTSSNNWWPSGGEPVADGNAHLDQPLPLLCKINADTGAVTTRDVFVGDWSQVNNMADPNMAVLDINNQTLTVTRTMYIGLRETTYQAVGVKAVGDVNLINGATVNVGGDLWVGSEGVGYLNVRDGDVTIAGTLRCPGGPQPAYTGQRYTAGTGNINLYGGSVTANDIYWRASDNTNINIAGGTLILNGDLTSAVAELISNNKMFAYGGGGNLQVDYNVRNIGKTTVTGTYNPNVAGYPSPANYAVDVALTAQLSWTAGASAISHNVYLGTSFSDVNNATTSSTGIFKGNQTAVAYNPGTLTPEQTYYWRIDELDGTNTYKGGIWQFTVVNPYIASIPTPVNNKTIVPSNQVLSWTKGISANSHDVYLSMNYDDVYNATTSSSSTIYRGRITSATYTPSDLLLGPKNYYWRVDEVNTVTSTVWKGKIWQFSTATYRTIDNFDTYTTTPGNRIYDVWKKSGGTSDVSAATYFADGTTALIDYNAMKVTFANSASPYYSEVNYPIPSTSSGAKRDWYSGGVAILGISLHGEATNIAAAKLYVIVKDANGHSVTVYYPDANQTVQRMDEYWPWWLIDLKKFSDSGIYMKSVRKLIIGLGDKATASGSGLLYVDNIALYPRWCPEGFNASFNQNADADLNNDCMVDMDDFEILVNDWLERSQTVTASAPPTPATDSDLVVWYKFDELSGYTAANSSMYGGLYDGLLAWDMWDTAGHDGNGGVILDNASAQYIDVPVSAVADTNLGGHSTVAFWLYESAPQTAGVQLFQMGASGTGNIQVWSEWSGDLTYVCGRKTNGWQESLFWGRYGYRNPASPIGQWNHYAFTKDHTAKMMKIYFNGKAVAEYTDADGATMPALGSGDYFTIGAYRYSDGTGGYFTGIMDDFRLYKRALTAAEVLSLAGGTSITQPILSQANTVADGIVNFKDFAVMADRWMEDPLLWP
jgi:hypothetical protein